MKKVIWIGVSSDSLLDDEIMYNVANTFSLAFPEDQVVLMSGDSTIEAVYIQDRRRLEELEDKVRVLTDMVDDLCNRETSQHKQYLVIGVEPDCTNPNAGTGANGATSES